MRAIQYQFLTPIIIIVLSILFGILVGNLLIFVLPGIVVATIIALGFAHRAKSRLRDAATNLSSATLPDGDPLLSVNTGDEIDALARAASRFIDLENARYAAEQSEHARHMQLLDRMIDGVMRVDEHGRVTYSNVAAGALFGGRSPINRSLLAVTHDHELNDRLFVCLRDGNEQRMTVDTPVNARVVNAVLVRINEDPAEALVVLRDVTELTRLQTMRRDFVANVSHELRTPLSTIKILTETLQTLTADADQQRFLSKIDTEVDEMTDLVAELLKLARLQSEGADLSMAPIKVDVMIESVRSRTVTIADQHDIAMLVENRVLESLQVLADERTLGQALLNLVHNAINHTQPGGKITIGAEHREGFIEFFVRDTGMGIAPENLPRIWERFYKADPARANSGTGLGLAIVKHTALAHGGDVSVTSELGEGSEFRIRVPVAIVADETSHSVRPVMANDA